MAKTYRTATVVIPPRAVWDPIQDIRRQLDRHYRRWMPHITLLYPFVPVNEWDASADRLHDACCSKSPFQVSITEFRTFRHARGSTLWLAPEPRSDLVALQAAMVEAIPECDDTSRHKGGFTPHLSVGQIRSSTRLEETLSKLQASWSPIRFAVSKVALIWRKDPPDDVFRIGRWIPLGLDPRQKQ
jgi:2'-5' RNA ligase